MMVKQKKHNNKSKGTLKKTYIKLFVLVFLLLLVIAFIIVNSGDDYEDDYVAEYKVEKPVEENNSITGETDVLGEAVINMVSNFLPWAVGIIVFASILNIIVSNLMRNRDNIL